MTKSLIVYYSRSGMNYVSGSIVNLPVGNTEVVALKISNLVNGEILKIEPVNDYPFEYDECTDQAKKELKKNERPPILNVLKDISSYDTVYLGYPNWWGTMPMVVCTFLENYDLSKATIIPFCTHEGSGMGVSVRDIKKISNAKAVHSGLSIKGSAVQSSDAIIKEFIDKL